MARLAFIRSKTFKYTQEEQVRSLEKKNIDKWYFDPSPIYSDRRLDTYYKNEFERLLNESNAGDTIYIYAFSCIAISLFDLSQTFTIIEDKNLTLVSVIEKIDTRTKIGKQKIDFFHSIQLFDNTVKQEKYRYRTVPVGTEIKKRGRKKTEINNNKLILEYTRFQNGEITKTELAQILGVSRPTLYKIIEKHNL